jgi:hypothetical protein
MSRLVKTKDYIAHSDNGSENLNDDVQWVIDRYKLVRSNTNKSMRSKKDTEPINAVMKRKVIYNYLDWSKTDGYFNLNLFKKRLSEWMYNFNNDTLVTYDKTAMDNIALKELVYYKSSKIVHNNIRYVFKKRRYN